MDATRFDAKRFYYCSTIVMILNKINSPVILTLHKVVIQKHSLKLSQNNIDKYHYQ